MTMRRMWCCAGLAALVLLATSCTPPRATDFDFNGDGRADHVWIDHAGDWRQGPVTDNVVIGHSDPDAAFVPGDYDGDGRVEVASVDHGGAGNWITASAAGTISFPEPAWPEGIPHNYGNFMVPVPGDYDGSGHVVPAWYRDLDGTWFIQGKEPIQFGLGPTTPAAVVSGQYPGGTSVDQDLPVPADYDGDGITDLAVYSPRTGSYRIRSSIDESVSDRTLLSTSADPLILPVPGDYDHVGHAQAAVWGASTGWVIEGHVDADTFGISPTTGSLSTPFTIPVPADYDGDGATDRAVIWSDGRWQVEHGWTTVTIGDGVSNGLEEPVEFTVQRLWNIARFTLVGKCLHDSFYC